MGRGKKEKKMVGIIVVINFFLIPFLFFSGFPVIYFFFLLILERMRIELGNSFRVPFMNVMNSAAHGVILDTGLIN
jgi:hypothetical protein